MTTRSKAAHPAGKRRPALIDPWAADRAAAATEVWRRRYWMTVSWAAFVIGLTLWAYGLALIWSVVR